MTSVILVVDDDPLAADLVEAVLHEAGFAILKAVNGYVAMEALENHPEVDLLLTDVAMPDLDGIMLADMAKTRWPGLKVIYTAGDAPPATLAGRTHGRTVDKPFRPTVLIQCVAETLGREPFLE